jgi:adenine deaminase
VIGPADVEEALTWPGIIGLGEMMNFPGVVEGNDKVHAEMSAARRAEKIIGGHYASPDLGLPFHAYVAGGAQDDHEGTRLEDAVQRIRQGQRVMLRYGSAWHDVAAQVPAILLKGLDPRHFILCTDDSHSQTLVSEGHMDRVLRHAMAQGLSPMAALQMATINTAEHFGVSRDIGCIAPGRWADVLLVRDLSDFRAEVVVARGRLAARDGALVSDLPAAEYPEWSRNTVRFARPLAAEDFRLKAGPLGPEASAHVIGVKENQAPTDHLVMRVAVRSGEVRADPARDLAKLAHLDRHHGSGKVQVGLVHGFGFRGKCAVATTVAHDCHNLLVAGTDDAQMALAANELAASGGGQVVVADGQVVGKVALPIAGLMSDRPAVEVARAAASVLDGFRRCGCALHNPNMQLSLLGLVVIPQLRLSDMGLVDVSKLSVIPVLE